jgi:chaperonin cofactor prefoldin
MVGGNCGRKDYLKNQKVLARRIETLNSRIYNLKKSYKKHNKKYNQIFDEIDSELQSIKKENKNNNLF